MGRAAVLRVLLEGRSAHAVLFGLLRSAWIDLRAGSTQRRVIAVRAPLPDASEHVVQAPRVGRKLCDGMVHPLGVRQGPAVLLAEIRIVAEVVRGFRSRAAGIFPLRFGGQTE